MAAPAQQSEPRLGNRTLRHRAEALGAALPPLLVAAERVAATVAQGVHGRRRVGQGETFWQFRHYQPGDSARMIDWRRSAKSQPVFVREHEWEAAQTVWLWSDASASMRYCSAPEQPEKIERANLLVLALAVLLSRAGERFALLGEPVAPSPGEAMLTRMAARLTADAEEAPSGGADFEALARSTPLPRHSRVVLASDFLIAPPVLETLVETLVAREVKGHLLQIFDPAEALLPFAGRLRFEGLENEGSLLIDRVEPLRDAYRARVAAHRDALTALAGRAGWTLSFHRTDHAPAPALLALYMALSESVEA